MGGKKDEKATQKEEKKDYKVGDTAEVDGIKIKVNKVRTDKGIIEADKGKEYFIMDITLENTTDEDLSSSSVMCFELKDADGRKQDQSLSVDLNGNMDTTVSAGEKATGEIAYEVKKKSKLTLTYTPKFGDSVKINVR